MLYDLKFALVRSGRTQRDVSLAAGIVETRFSDIVRGKCLPTVQERRRIARVLNLRVASLFRPSAPSEKGDEA